MGYQYFSLPISSRDWFQLCGHPIACLIKATTFHHDETTGRLATVHSCTSIISVLQRSLSMSFVEKSVPRGCRWHVSSTCERKNTHMYTINRVHLCTLTKLHDSVTIYSQMWKDSKFEHPSWAQNVTRVKINKCPTLSTSGRRDFYDCTSATKWFRSDSEVPEGVPVKFGQDIFCKLINENNCH